MANVMCNGFGNLITLSRITTWIPLAVRRRGTLYLDIYVILFTLLPSWHDYSRHFFFSEY